MGHAHYTRRFCDTCEAEREQDRDDRAIARAEEYDTDTEDEPTC
jgi:hypothetical protein